MTVAAVHLHHSPNQSPRPDGVAIDAIIVHADAGRTTRGTLAWIGDPASKVSYHYLIGRDGAVHACVPDERKAWHAGISSLHGRALCNEFSLGVAFANDQRGEPFTPSALAAGVSLCADLCRRYGIPLTRIARHSDVSPGRKVDPGPLFPWADFRIRIGDALKGGS